MHFLSKREGLKLISKGHPKVRLFQEISYEILQSYALSEMVLGTTRCHTLNSMKVLTQPEYTKNSCNHIPLNLRLYSEDKKKELKQLRVKVLSFAVFLNLL